MPNHSPLSPGGKTRSARMTTRSSWCWPRLARFLIVRKDQVELSRDEVAKGIATFHPDTAANVQDIGTRLAADVAQRSGQQPGAPLPTSRRGQEESVVA